MANAHDADGPGIGALWTLGTQRARFSYRFARSPPSTPRYWYGVARYALYAYNIAVTVTLDPEKNAANLRKHGVSLAEGDGVLNDPLALTIEDDSAEGEQRFVSIRMNSFGSLMVVAYRIVATTLD